MGCPWDAHGLPMDIPWTAHVLPVDCPWDAHGLSVGSPWSWADHGHPMGCPWAAHGMPMDGPCCVSIGCLWAARRLPMGIPRTTHAMPMALSWDAHGLSLGCPWAVRGLPMVAIGSPWAAHGLPMGCPWANRGQSAGCQWLTTGCYTRVRVGLPMSCPWAASGLPVARCAIGNSSRRQIKQVCYLQLSSLRRFFDFEERVELISQSFQNYCRECNFSSKIYCKGVPYMAREA